MHAIKQEISCRFKEFACLFLGSWECTYDGETYQKGTFLNITSKGECYLYKCKGQKFRKVRKAEIIQYCDEPCEMGWLPGCCMCKRKSEFAFIILLKSYISVIVSRIVTPQILFLILLLYSIFSFCIPSHSISMLYISFLTYSFQPPSSSQSSSFSCTFFMVIPSLLLKRRLLFPIIIFCMIFFWISSRKFRVHLLHRVV